MNKLTTLFKYFMMILKNPRELLVNHFETTSIYFSMSSFRLIGIWQGIMFDNTFTRNKCIIVLSTILSTSRY